MWVIWTEQNRRSFEDTRKSLVQLLVLCFLEYTSLLLIKKKKKLLVLCQWTLFDWSWCWGLSDCSTHMDFLLSLRIA